MGKYIDEYNLFQRIKNHMEALAEKLIVNEVPKKPWMHLTMNLITKLQIIAGKDMILVVCNKLFNMIHFVAITEGTSVEELARLFRHNV